MRIRDDGSRTEIRLKARQACLEKTQSLKSYLFYNARVGSRAVRIRETVR